MKIHISRNGHTYGPYSVTSVEAFLVNGQLFPNDLAWSHGKSGWTPLKDILDQAPNGTIEKIRTLLENDEINFALDLIKGLDDQDLIIELLKDCKIDENEGWIELPDWMNGANGFFLELLQELPEEF